MAGRRQVFFRQAAATHPWVLFTTPKSYCKLQAIRAHFQSRIDRLLDFFTLSLIQKKVCVSIQRGRPFFEALLITILRHVNLFKFTLSLFKIARLAAQNSATRREANAKPTNGISASLYRPMPK
jgi:hypothetical protein